MISLIVVAVLFIANFLASSFLDKIAEGKVEKNEKLLKTMKGVYSVQVIVYLIIGALPMLFLFGGLETWFEFCEGYIKFDYISAASFLTLSMTCSYMKRGVEYMLDEGGEKMFGLEIPQKEEV